MLAPTTTAIDSHPTRCAKLSSTGLGRSGAPPVAESSHQSAAGRPARQ
jgi:hypothetical protein